MCAHVRVRAPLTAVLDASVLTVLTSAPVFLVGAANDLVRNDLGLAVEAVGSVFTVYWLGSLAGAYLSRRADNRGSLETQLVACALLTALGLVIMATVPVIGLWVGAALGGACYGYSQPYTNLLLSRRCSVRNRGLTFGVKQAAIPLATLLSSLSISVVAIPLGWRAAFLIAAGLSMVHALSLGRRSSGEDASIPAPTGGSAAPMGGYLLAMAAALFGSSIGNSLGSYLVPSLTHREVSLVTASLLAGVASATSMLVRVLSGMLVDRNARRPELLLAVMFAVGVLGTGLLAAATGDGLFVGAVLAYGGGWGWAGLVHYAAAAAHPGAENRATAVTQMGVSVGAALGPLVFGWIFAHAGPGSAWWVETVAGVLACGAVLAAARVRSPEGVAGGPLPGVGGAPRMELPKVTD